MPDIMVAIWGMLATIGMTGTTIMLAREWARKEADNG